MFYKTKIKTFSKTLQIEHSNSFQFPEKKIRKKFSTIFPFKKREKKNENVEMKIKTKICSIAHQINLQNENE